MPKNCDFSKARKRLMKNLKVLSERLDESPPCRLQPISCAPYCQFSCPRVPYKPQTCHCFLVPNTHQCSCSSMKCSKSCGPFPEDCTTILPPKPCFPCASISCAIQRSQPLCCSSMRCRKHCCPSACCKRESCCRRTRQCCKSRCCKPHYCRQFCCCKRVPCCSCCIEFKKCPTGSICYGCHSICVPRCKSDSALPKQCLPGKKLRCSRSLELRGGVIYDGCDCDKKNGLQDRCLRYCCINNPKCKTEPASCHCSKFSCGKHLSKRYSGRKKMCRSYTCYICKPPICPCVPSPVLPCYPMMACTRRCCCPRKCCFRRKCECECQCRPSTCEAECCCSLNVEPNPCSPCISQCLPPTTGYEHETSMCTCAKNETSVCSCANNETSICSCAENETSMCSCAYGNECTCNEFAQCPSDTAQCFCY